jgi:osmotically-inducible protein OsmY
MTDVSLRQDIIDELDFEPAVNSAHIGVAVADGVVTLSGHVGSYAEKIAAENAARRVKGVRAIAQEIDVRYANDKKTSDDEIAARALAIMRWNTVVPPDSLQIRVQNGWVTLTGELDWQFQRVAAEDQIRKLSGVAGVMNSITLKPRAKAPDVKLKIEEALKRSAEVEASNIQVTMVGDGRVALEGKVHDWQERQAVTNAAWSANCILSVEDRLSFS